MKLLTSNAILADYIHRRDDGKLDVLGVVGGVVGPKFPVNLGQMWYYCRISVEGQVVGDTTSLSVRLRHPDDTVVDVAVAEFKATEPGSGTIDLVMQVPPVSLPVPGTYRIELGVGETIASSVAFEARTA